MAKKFDNLGKTKNIGLSVLIDEPQSSVQPVEQEKELIKTFQYKSGDIAYLEKYVRFMAFKEGSKYPIKRAISDAIALLREKYPEEGLE